MSIIEQNFNKIPPDIETQMLIAPVLGEMIATQAFAVGEQFIVNSTLYKATKAIAIGDMISVGTGANDNCILSDSITQQLKGEWKDISLSMYVHGTTTPVTHGSSDAIKYKRIGDVVDLNITLSGMEANTDIDVVIASNIPDEIKLENSARIIRAMLVSDFSTGLFANFVMNNSVIRIKTHSGGSAMGEVTYII